MARKRTLDTSIDFIRDTGTEYSVLKQPFEKIKEYKLRKKISDSFFFYGSVEVLMKLPPIGSKIWMLSPHLVDCLEGLGGMALLEVVCHWQ